METFEQNKLCEKCGAAVPDSYGNLLCDTHYSELQNPPEEPKTGKFGILDPNYEENPEQEDKEQVLANITQFLACKKLLWYAQRNMYTWIKNYARDKAMAHPQYPKQIWKPHIVDVGCGSGVGSNVLSQEAHQVWGIDKNERSIAFAKEAFTREKNNIYYSGQLTFDIFDIMEDSRETQKFDFVVAIEIIEHIYDTDKFLRKLIEKFASKDKKGNYAVPSPTEFFISTPNRNNPKIKKDKPENIFHVREWTSEEFHALLSSYFRNVELYEHNGKKIEGTHTEQSPIFAKCSLPV